MAHVVVALKRSESTRLEEFFFTLATLKKGFEKYFSNLEGRRTRNDRLCEIEDVLRYADADQGPKLCDKEL